MWRKENFPASGWLIPIQAGNSRWRLVRTTDFHDIVSLSYQSAYLKASCAYPEKQGCYLGVGMHRLNSTTCSFRLLSLCWHCPDRVSLLSKCSCLRSRYVTRNPLNFDIGVIFPTTGSASTGNICQPYSFQRYDTRSSNRFGFVSTYWIRTHQAFVRFPPSYLFFSFVRTCLVDQSNHERSPHATRLDRFRFIVSWLLLIKFVSSC